MILCYVAIHLKSLYAPKTFPLPWAIDNSIGAIVFLYLGDLFKRYQFRPWHVIWVLIPIWFIWANSLFAWDYQINMKAMKYNHCLLDLLVPCSFSFALYLGCLALKRVAFVNSLLAYLGQCCITIFFVHAIFLHYLDGYLPPVRVLIALAGGVIVHTIFNKNRFTRLLFIGKK